MFCLVFMFIFNTVYHYFYLPRRYIYYIYSLYKEKKEKCHYHWVLKYHLELVRVMKSVRLSKYIYIYFLKNILPTLYKTHKKKKYKTQQFDFICKQYRVQNTSDIRNRKRTSF